MLAAPYMFGMNVEGLKPGQAAVVDDHAFGWPAARLAAVPAGDYYVQAVLNRYETYHLADGRTLKLPPDRGEGQQWATKPGNLYSTPAKLHVDPAHPASFKLALDQEVPPVCGKGRHGIRQAHQDSQRSCSQNSGGAMSTSARTCCCPRALHAHPNDTLSADGVSRTFPRGYLGVPH